MLSAWDGEGQWRAARIAKCGKWASGCGASVRENVNHGGSGFLGLRGLDRIFGSVIIRVKERYRGKKSEIYKRVLLEWWKGELVDFGGTALHVSE